MVSPVINMPNTQKHSGVSGIPTQLMVVHSGECPLRGGYAQSLTQWANIPEAQGGPQASWHWFADPIAIVSMVDPMLAAWHASEANPMSEGFEQAGYARFSREEWLTAEGRKSIDNLAWILAQRMKANGIPHRWLTTDEVEAVTKRGNRSIKGLCVHRQIDPETRTDPGDNYPFDVLDERIAVHLGTAPETTTTDEDDEMLVIGQLEGSTEVWVGNGVVRTHVPNPQALAGLQHLCSLGIYKAWRNGEVMIVGTIDALGRDVVGDSAAATLHMPIQWFGFDGKVPAEGRNTTTLFTDIGWSDARVAGTNGLLHGLTAQVGTLADLLAKGSDSGVTKEEILDRLDATFKESLAQYTPALVPNTKEG